MVMSLFTFILFILILTVLIFVHELGHFLAAKWVGMKVEEFSIGFFNPKLFSKKIGETEYSIRAFLLGGYVKILGENGAEGKDSSDPRAFSNRSYWSQVLVLIAGVTMNLILAYLLFVVNAFGVTTATTDNEDFRGRFTNERIIINEVLAGSPAANAGIKPGAQLLQLESKLFTSQKIAPSSLFKPGMVIKEEEVIAFIDKNKDLSLTITYQNPNGAVSSTTLALVYGLVPEKKALGISILHVGDVHIGFFESFVVGAKQLYHYTALTLQGLYDLFANLFKGENVLKSLSGPVGIATLVGEASDVGYKSVILLMAFLSLNLAILNILPLPALDGGQLLKITIEKLMGRTLKESYSGWLNALGFFFLIGLLIAVTINDILKLFN
jgi:regulator of sigma E protease